MKTETLLLLGLGGAAVYTLLSKRKKPPAPYCEVYRGQRFCVRPVDAGRQWGYAMNDAFHRDDDGKRTCGDAVLPAQPGMPCGLGNFDTFEETVLQARAFIDSRPAEGGVEGDSRTVKFTVAMTAFAWYGPDYQPAELASSLMRLEQAVGKRGYVEVGKYPTEEDARAAAVQYIVSKIGPIGAVTTVPGWVPPED